MAGRPVEMHRPDEVGNRSGTHGLESVLNMTAEDRQQEEPPQTLLSRHDLNHNNHSAADVEHFRQSSTSSRQQHVRPKRIACKGCRQAKLRCEGLKNSGEPCTRCRRLSLACQVDGAYKRVKKRLINELVDELEYLRTAVKQKDVSSSEQNPTHFPPSVQQQQQSTSLATTLSSPTNTAIPIGNEDQCRMPQGAGNTATAANDGCFTARPPTELAHNMASSSFKGSAPRSLKHVELTGREIDDLFALFFQHYHCFLEILDQSTQPDLYYARSSALFWTIICIAARRYDKDATLLGNLDPLVSSLVWSTALKVPLPAYTIQALILLATWRSPHDSQWKDPALLFATVARTAAMQNGLHKPESVQDFLRVKTQLAPDDFQEAVKLWAGCYIVAESVTTTAGQPSLFSEDWTIDRACEEGNRYSLSLNLRYSLLIQRFLGRVNVTMARNNRSPGSRPSDKEGDGLMRLLECDLDDLEQLFGEHVTDIHRIAITMGRLQLRTFYFLETCLPESRKQGLLKAYTTALVLISELAEADTRTDFMIYAPSTFPQMLVTAGMLVMKMVHSSYDRYIDIDDGKRSFNVALGLLRRCGLEDNDTSGRATKILAQLWTIHKQHRNEPSLKVRSRLGASVLHDGLWTWREEFGGQGTYSSNAPHLSTPTPTPQPTHTAPANTRVNDELAFTDNAPIQHEQQFNQPFPASQSNLYINSLVEDISNLDWSWDVGCPPLLPDGVGSVQMMPMMYHTGT